MRWGAVGVAAAAFLSVLTAGPSGSGGEGGAEAAVLRAVVADLPYARVWEASLRAMAGYTIERAADGIIVAQPRERAARPEEPAFLSVAETVVVRVEAFGERITRVSVEVVSRGLRGGEWVRIPEAEESTARAILDRLKEEQR